ncbi:hypothetical protein AB1Y20_019837 [Prymnesium parvum]|uniref:CAAX prenyl protease 2/Lysostaphin resistance protein A-like domain-containing protein n=1 Tax=Prymnesium parvum TaxID=97485 RepID=A0AB34JS49_PRYPA
MVLLLPLAAATASLACRSCDRRAALLPRARPLNAAPPSACTPPSPHPQLRTPRAAELIRMCDGSRFAPSDGEAGSAPPPPPPTQSESSSSPPPVDWTLGDVASGAALFVLLHAIAQTAAGASADPKGLAALGRVCSTASFVGVQQAAGLPASRWLPRGDCAAEAQPAFQQPLAPLAACALFAAVAFAPPLALRIAGYATEAQALMPSARPLPGAAHAVELLLAAPITEEIFFRGWLLSGLRRAGVDERGALAASALCFSLWHLGSGDGLLFYGLLGAMLGLVYQRSGSLLWVPMATHCLWNLLIVVVRWQSM